MKKYYLCIAVITLCMIGFVGCNKVTPDIAVKTKAPSSSTKATTLISTTPTQTPIPTLTPTLKPTVDPSLFGTEKYLTDLKYESFTLNGTDEPFYGIIPHSGEYLEVKGVRFVKGVFINPTSGGEPGVVTYDISTLPYNRFVAKVGKLDVAHGAGDPVKLYVYIDGKVVAESPEMSQGDEAYLIDVVFEAGAQKLELMCESVSGVINNSSAVFGDAQLCYKDAAVKWPG